MPVTSTSPAERCVLNVATGRYVPLQKRLVESLAGEEVMVWTDAWPAESPDHRETPYAFKLFAIREALERGRTSVLWVDAPCYAVASLDPVFEKIRREHHYFVSAGDKLGNWASDACLDRFDFTRDQAMGMDLMNGAFIGLDLARARSRRWYDAMMKSSRDGLFNGPHFSDHAPAEIRARKPGKPAGFVSHDPRAWGHRHDEAVGTCLAHRLGMKISRAGELSDVLRSPNLLR